MVESNWLEVSLIVDGELAESVAEVLARYVPNGVIIESTAVDTSDPETVGHPIGPLRVCGYIPMDYQAEERRQKIEEALWYLSRIRPLPIPTFRSIQETEWAEAWKENYVPITVGSRLLITPAWPTPETSERVPICIDPGMAFGTGTHPTTQLCLEYIEMYQDTAANPQETKLIDVGCGSAILSIAALKLGARKALAVDIDPEAVKVAHGNADLNKVSEDLDIHVGSLSDIQAGKFGLRNAHLVVANILAPVIITMLGEGLGDLLLPQGRLIISGILVEQLSKIKTALSSTGMELIEHRMIEDWVAVIACRP